MSNQAVHSRSLNLIHKLQLLQFISTNFSGTTDKNVSKLLHCITPYYTIVKISSKEA
jgi:hypothetical protein